MAHNIDAHCGGSIQKINCCGIARLKYSYFSKRLKEVKHETFEVMDSVNCSRLQVLRDKKGFKFHFVIITGNYVP